MPNLSGEIRQAEAKDGVFARIAPTIVENVGGKYASIVEMPPIARPYEADRSVEDDAEDGTRHARVTTIRTGTGQRPPDSHRRTGTSRVTRVSQRHRHHRDRIRWQPQREPYRRTGHRESILTTFHRPMRHALGPEHIACLGRGTQTHHTQSARIAAGPRAQ